MRRQERINADWRFHLGEVENGGYQGLDDSAWTRVTVPHDWAVTQPFSQSCSSGTGYLPGGVGWYRRHFAVPDDLRGRRVTVTFGGVHKNSRCYINSNYLGMRPYGYSTFRYDITEFLKPGDNVLCVRAEHIDLADSRWFTGNGITREVTLTFTDACCYDDDGIFAHTDECDECHAVLAVDWRARACGEAAFELLDASGACAARVSDRGEGGSARLAIDRPHLWSPDSPYLYTLRATLSAHGQVRDCVDTVVGIRSVHFDADQGFFLNERPMKLKGVCVHHDAGALGAAVPKPVWARRLSKLKAAGCNAIRFSHNPPDPTLIDVCDEMGFLAIDEAFDEWEGCKNKWWQGHNVYPPKHFGYSDAFPMWHEADLTAMILRDRNHPSIILWSIGNEIDYPNDPYVHASFKTMTGNNDANKPAQERQYDPNRPNAERLTTVALKLAAIVRRCDPTRPVNSALAFPELSVPIGYAAALDVVGYNYKEELYEKTHREHPDYVLLGTENGHAFAAWQTVTRNAYVCGQFLWTGIDFLGEARGWPIRISQAGLLDLAGYEKPLYHYRKALWTDAPMAKLAASADGAIWHESFDWDYEPGSAMTVSCYTNCDQAELLLNGHSMGIRVLGEDDGCRAAWNIAYEPGEVRVICLKDGREAASDALRTPGKAARIDLLARVDGCIAQVEARLLDDQGVLVNTRDVMLSYAAEYAELLGIENGDPQDLTAYALHERKTHHGQAIVYLRLVQGRPATLTVSSNDGLSVSISLS